GDGETRERAQAWALQHDYRLLAARPCVHGLLIGRCRFPSGDGDGPEPRCPAAWDHGRIWAGPGIARFLLAHLYDDSLAALDRAEGWAAHHWLRVESLVADSWYGHGTVPLRFSPLAPARGALAQRDPGALATPATSGAPASCGVALVNLHTANSGYAGLASLLVRDGAHRW
ncbi:MAG: hypothetical protein ABSF27_09615, partial [Candidatus Dormibacteria bacterium]